MQRYAARFEADDPHDTLALLYGLASMASFVAACLGYRTRALSLSSALLVLLASVVALGLCRRHLDSQRRTGTPCKKADVTTSLSRPPPSERSNTAPPVESCLFTWELSPSGSSRQPARTSASSSAKRSSRCDRTSGRAGPRRSSRPVVIESAGMTTTWNPDGSTHPPRASTHVVVIPALPLSRAEEHPRSPARKRLRA